MLSRDRVVWTLAIFVCAALLVAPALWNGFPLLQYDTGGYLARWYEGYLVPSRAVVYGLLLNAGEWGNLWPVVALQAALTIWVIALVLRVQGLLRPLVLVGIIAALSVVTTLPWLTAILLTDIFCGLGVLAFYLIVLRTDAISRTERVGLIVLTAIAAATHSATLAVLLALFLCAALAWLGGGVAPVVRLRSGFAALVLGAALVLTANFAVSRQVSWTPGGFALSFGRMLQDGIVKRYLDDHCPDPKLRLCPYKDELPRDADEWFWGNDLFIKLGRFAGLGHEMAAITLDSITAYPWLQIKAAVVASVRQLFMMSSGEGVLDTIWHTYGIMERHTPALLPAMRAARQQHGEISFERINLLHWPAAVLSMAALAAIVLLMRRRELAAARELAAVAALAILANAAICGVFSNPHDRYGARIVWIATFAVLVAALQQLGTARDT